MRVRIRRKDDGRMIYRDAKEINLGFEKFLIATVDNCTYKLEELEQTDNYIVYGLKEEF